jgi:hypothetical protein
MAAYEFLTGEPGVVGRGFHQTPDGCPTDGQVEHFLKYGWLRLNSAFTEDKVRKFTQDVWVRLGMDEHDQSTWSKERINMPRESYARSVYQAWSLTRLPPPEDHRHEPVQTFSPLAWGAMCELLVRTVRK